MVYASQIATAQRLIKKKGQLVTWVPRDVTIADPTKPWHETSVVGPPTFPVSIVFVSAGSSLANDLFHLMKGSSVPEGAPKGLMGAVTGFTPQVNDTVLRGTETLTVKAIDIVEPNGESILYKIAF